ncbi:uncharacterized protein [Henckelia pumila]|uniref:uncharacterized protein n=1 Tax=Henckelia pumila TaxID=405737 RepID=UPI003C6DFF4C
MSNISKLEFAALDISGKNYLSWILDVEIHLDVMGIENTIKEKNQESPQNRAKAMIFLRHHLHDDLKFDSQLKLCGKKITDDDLLKKTYSTFHAFNVVLQQQYREKGFKRYSDLILCLLVAEQNNELLMKNHEIRSTGANPFPEVNMAMHDEKMKQNKTGFNRGRGRGRGHFHPYGRGHEKPRYFNDGYNNNDDQRNESFKKCGNDQEKNVESGQNDKSMNLENG